MTLLFPGGGCRNYKRGCQWKGWGDQAGGLDSTAVGIKIQTLTLPCPRSSFFHTDFQTVSEQRPIMLSPLLGWNIELELATF